jgi:hypothetical protein
MTPSEGVHGTLSSETERRTTEEKRPSDIVRVEIFTDNSVHVVLRDGTHLHNGVSRVMYRKPAQERGDYRIVLTGA